MVQSHSCSALACELGALQISSQGIWGRNTWQLVPCGSHVGHYIPYVTVYICQGLSLPSAMGKPDTSSEIGVHSPQGQGVFESLQLLPSTIRREATLLFAKARL